MKKETLYAMLFGAIVVFIWYKFVKQEYLQQFPLAGTYYEFVNNTRSHNDCESFGINPASENGTSGPDKVLRNEAIDEPLCKCHEEDIEQFKGNNDFLSKLQEPQLQLIYEDFDVNEIGDRLESVGKKIPQFVQEQESDDDQPQLSKLMYEDFDVNDIQEKIIEVKKKTDKQSRKINKQLSKKQLEEQEGIFHNRNRENFGKGLHLLKLGAKKHLEEHEKKQKNFTEEELEQQKVKKILKQHNHSIFKSTNDFAPGQVDLLSISGGNTLGFSNAGANGLRFRNY